MLVGESVWAVIVARVGQWRQEPPGGALSAAQRRELALAMLADVVEVCVQARGVVAGTLAVVDSPEARLAVERGGAIAVPIQAPAT